VSEPGLIASLIEQANAHATRLRRLGKRQVDSKAMRQDIQGFVRRYFTEIRPGFPPTILDLDAIGLLDNDFQDLQRCTQRRSQGTTYAALLKSIARIASEIEISSLAAPPARVADAPLPDKERLLLATIEKISPSAARSFEQGLLDLRSTARHSWRGPAVEFRESLREVLDYLAPDKDVESQPGYKQEKDTTGPTMKQKVVFILKSRRKLETQVKSLTDTVRVVEEMVGGFVRSVYQRTSAGTHATPTREEVNKIREYVTLALMEILEVSHYPA
jgi:hypothetical protein